MASLDPGNALLDEHGQRRGEIRDFLIRESRRVLSIPI
jgi:hypothetical protein